FQAEDGIRDGHVTGVRRLLFRSSDIFFNSAFAMLSRSNRFAVPPAATDHANAELKKMSDSFSSPVCESTRKLVDARTRSISGRLDRKSVVEGKCRCRQVERRVER